MKKRPHEHETASEPPPDEEPSARAADPAAAHDDETARLAAENERLRGELELVKQRLLEAAADLDNQAKRFARERPVVREEAVVRTAREMIEVLDNLDRVVAAVAPDERSSPLVQGVIATQALFVDKLRALGVESIPARDLQFDPFQHEALAEEERDDVAPGTIVDEISRGWRTANQLVRAAQVRVARAPRRGERERPDSDAAEDGATGAAT